MDWPLGTAILFALLFSGIPIGFALTLVGFVGVASLIGIDPALAMIGQVYVDSGRSYTLSVVPLFLLMGNMIVQSGIADEIFDAANAWLRHRRGGLAMATIVACGGFGSVCGSSLATAATMTKVAMPSMRRFGYRDSLATGVVAAGGTLGIMIPPSVPLVIYGIIAEQDIGRLFLAGMVPGICLVLLFMAVVWIWSRLDPSVAPMEAETEPGAATGPVAARVVWPVVGLFVLVLGGIYGRLFTPTEAAGVGAVGAAFIALGRGKLRGLRDWTGALTEAAQTTASLFLVIFGALVFAEYANYTGLSYAVTDWVEAMDLSGFGLVVVIALIAILMGMVFESIGILLLLVPVFLPTLLDSGVDMIWFGIIIVLVTELGLITPPVGMNVFVVKSVLPDADLGQMFRGVMPFVLAMLVALLALLLVPPLAIFVPDLVY